MTSSDSSDDEPNLTLLREACDVDLLSESLYGGGPATKIAPSLRPDRRDNGDDALDVTPGFRRHVAKRLGEIIDRRLEELLIDKIQGGHECKNGHKGGGVRLLSDSKGFVDVEGPKIGERIKSEVRTRKVVAKKKRVSDDLLDEEVKVKLAAVDTDDVLSQKEVRNWATFNKGKVFRYKRGEGGALLYIDDGFS